MISAVRTIDRRRGFTLLEIVVVLAIAGMVMAGAVGLMIASADERALKNISSRVEVFAKRARTISILHQTPYALEFRMGEIRLLPLAEAGHDGEGILPPDILDNSRQAPEDADKRLPVHDQLAVPADMVVSIRRWNSKGWTELRKGGLEIWRFDPDGLCEPVSIHYALPKSWAEDTFHPLTASIRESLLEAK